MHLIIARERSKEEQKAYADGYTASFEQFCEYIESRELNDAITAMELMVGCVNAWATETTEKTDCPWK